MAATDARPLPLKNTAFRAYFPILDADGDKVTGATGLDSEVSIDGAAFADCTSEATEIGSSGTYYLDLTAGEMNGDAIVVQVKTSTVGAKTTDLYFYPAEDGDMRVNVVQFGSAAGTFSGGRPEVNTTHAAGTAWGSGAITAASIAADAITAAKVADGTIDAATFAANAITSTVVADNTITAAKIAADAITDAKVAADVTIASVTGAVGSVTGAVGSVTGNVGGNVVGSVASVVGAVGSVTGNVGGNVTGSVGSVAAGGIAAASFAASAIDAAALAANAVDEILDEQIGDSTITMRQALKLSVAALGGILAGAATTTITVRNAGNTVDVITATVDANGNRSAVTLSL